MIFIELIHRAEERGIRVIADLVMNHTSNQHPWFEAARRDKNSRYHDYYVWTDAPPPSASQESIFPDRKAASGPRTRLPGLTITTSFSNTNPALKLPTRRYSTKSTR